MRIGIVGGGLMGLAIARRLSREGHGVTVFEREPQLGGLATWHDFGGFDWDRFYHVILPTDSSLIGFIRDLGLEDALRWGSTRTGFYVDEQFHSMDNNIDFLKFPPLSLWSKFRLAMTILYCSRINDWRRLEKISVEDWLIKTSGRATYEKMWKPLLLAKLGENYKRASAVFIWSYIKRLFSARDSSVQKEHMGHVHGGYKVVFERAAKLIAEQGGVIRNPVTVSKIAAVDGGGMSVEYDQQREVFDKVIFTSPVNVLRQLVDPELIKVTRTGADVEYLGVVCGVLITRKPLVPYYVVNIADSRVPFTGVIGMSSIVPVEETGGFHLTYLPKYVLSTDPLLNESEEVLHKLFMDGLQLMFPDFDAADIEALHINRAVKVQPLQVIDYSQIVPTCDTAHPDLFVVNTAQFVNNTLNNNQVITTVNNFFDEFSDRFAETEQQVGDLPLAQVSAR